MSNLKRSSKTTRKRKKVKSDELYLFDNTSSVCLFKNDFEQGYNGDLDCRKEDSRDNVFKIETAACFYEFFKPYRYKIAHGGRGGGKSWAYADMLITRTLEAKIRVLCCRELQTSISQSVHQLLVDRINNRGLEEYFTITNNEIVCNLTGSQFIFKGLRFNSHEIKSLEGIDICWVEEAQKVSKNSWDLLIPTIRKENSEIWISFNPNTPYEETWIRFIENKESDSLVVSVNYNDNPWFPHVLELERQKAKRNMPKEDYDQIWEGIPKLATKAQIFADCYKVEAFESPKNTRIYQGADWGFAADPSVLMAMFMKKDTLYIEHEASQEGCDIEKLDVLFDNIPFSRKWLIRADASRPELIKSVKRKGFIIRGCKKWPGSVEDGVNFLRQLENIIIHPRCVRTIEEFRLYAYKQDKTTEDILPQIVDKNNHCMDAIRYALEPVILGKVKKDKK